MDRSEEDKLLQSPIIVVLGGKEYQIKPLVIRDSREWRKQVAKALGQLPKYISVTTDDADAFSRAMEAMLVEMPDVVADLFFGYAQDLKRDEIEAVATDGELAVAFQEVIKVGFPLVGSLAGILTKPSP